MRSAAQRGREKTMDVDPWLDASSWSEAILARDSGFSVVVSWSRIYPGSAESVGCFAIDDCVNLLLRNMHEITQHNTD